MIDRSEAVKASLICGFVLCSLLLSSCRPDFQTPRSSVLVAEEAFDRQRLMDGLEQVLSWHKENSTDIVSGLRPGLAISRIDELLRDAGCEPTAEMRTLWSWHDGAQAASPFIWYYNFLSVDEAISQRKLLTRIPFSAWPPTYLPVFDFDGEWYGIRCGGEGRTAGPVLHYYLEDSPRITHINLTAFMSQMAEVLTTGAVTWQDSAMVEDINAVYRIHQQHNPGYPFPYYVDGL